MSPTIIGNVCCEIVLGMSTQTDPQPAPINLSLEMTLELLLSCRGF